MSYSILTYFCQVRSDYILLRRNSINALQLHLKRWLMLKNAFYFLAHNVNDVRTSVFENNLDIIENKTTAENFDFLVNSSVRETARYTCKSKHFLLVYNASNHIIKFSKLNYLTIRVFHLISFLATHMF